MLLVLDDQPDLQRLEVRLCPSVTAAGTDAPTARCVNYPTLSGPASQGDELLINTTAVDLMLGTGGWHFAVANLTRASEVPQQRLGPDSGHIMKLRYTPHQFAADAWEAAEAGAEQPDTLGGLPVVVCALHSHLAPTVLGFLARFRREADRPPSIVYLMGDSAALPIALSEQTRQLRAAGLPLSTITCGQAFGGDLEAITLASGLVAARHRMEADVVVVAQGPGNAGAGHPYGCGATSVADAVNTAAALGGRPIVAPRLSFADPRPRHHGVSHHTRVALERLALAPAEVAFPVLPAELDATIAADVEAIARKHWVVRVDSDDLRPLLEDSPVPLRSMGRGFGEDPWFFLAPAAAGACAAGSSVAAGTPGSSALRHTTRNAAVIEGERHGSGGDAHQQRAHP